jgi:hypothetical protein
VSPVLLAISPLAWFFLFLLAGGLATAYLVACIVQAILATPAQLEVRPVAVQAPAPRSVPAELDDLLGGAGVDFDFNVSTTSARTGETAGRATHDGGRRE